MVFLCLLFLLRYFDEGFTVVMFLKNRFITILEGSTKNTNVPGPSSSGAKPFLKGLNSPSVRVSLAPRKEGAGMSFFGGDFPSIVS